MTGIAGHASSVLIWWSKPWAQVCGSLVIAVSASVRLRIIRACAWALLLRAAGVPADTRRGVLIDAARRDLGSLSRREPAPYRRSSIRAARPRERGRR